MALEADLLIDRRRLKRHLNFWRVLAVVALVCVALVAAPVRHGGFGQRIARFRIAGTIGDCREQIYALNRQRDDSASRNWRRASRWWLSWTGPPLRPAI
jgi:protease-4